MEIGVVGLGLAGKTTLVQALTGGKVAGTGSKVSIAFVPDTRLGKLATIFKPKRVVHSEVSFAEMPKIQWGEDMFGGEALGWLQKMDALLVVVRAFTDDSVAHPEGSVDFARDLENLLFNLAFADIALLDNRIARLKAGVKGKKVAERALIATDIEILQELQRELERGTRATEMDLTQEQSKAIDDAFLLSRLPVIVVVNIGEQDLPRTAELESAANEVTGSRVQTVCVCAKLEHELNELPADEQLEMRSGLGAPPESGAEKVISLAFSALSLISFLTVGEDEVRAWQTRRDSTAPKAAGKVHSDIARGFISAQVISFDEFMKLGSMSEARKRGTLRKEGKGYIVKDGDIVNFLFSV